VDHLLEKRLEPIARRERTNERFQLSDLCRREGKLVGRGRRTRPRERCECRAMLRRRLRCEARRDFTTRRLEPPCGVPVFTRARELDACRERTSDRREI